MNEGISDFPGVLSSQRRRVDLTIEHTALSGEQVRANLAAAGLPAPMAEVLERFQDASANGLFDVVTHDVERLSGRPAQSPVDFIVAALKAQGAQA